MTAPTLARIAGTAWRNASADVPELLVLVFGCALIGLGLHLVR